MLEYRNRRTPRALRCSITASSGMSVCSVQPAAATRPSRTSTETTTRVHRPDPRTIPGADRTRRGSSEPPWLRGCRSRAAGSCARAGDARAYPDEAVKHAQPGQRGLLGVELDAEHRISADDRREAL